MDHVECVHKLIEIGENLNFYAKGGIRGTTRYKLANPDCVWYLKTPLPEILQRIPKSEGGKFLPFIAFEVAFSEKEKALRGSIMSLQVANAAAGIIVLLGESAAHREYLEKLVEKSLGRFAIWTEDDVKELYSEVMKTKPER